MLNYIPISIWPDIINYLPAIVPLKKLVHKKKNVRLDFSNCKKIQSTGLNILLMRLLKLIKADNIERYWDLMPLQKNTDESSVIERITSLGFFEILNDYIPSKNIFWGRHGNTALENTNSANNYVISYPIYKLDLKSANDRREPLSGFTDWLHRILMPFSREYDISSNQLMMILHEISKNSADHTDSDAFFGMDIEFNQDKSLMNLNFSIGDLGCGIKKNVENFLTPTKREKKMSLSEAYYFALQHGRTTKNSSEMNLGYGMSMILDGAKRMSLKLFIFDAMSGGLVTDISEISHSHIRKNFINIGNDVDFCYYGELTARR
jgi:hypothetical protein